MAEVIQSGASPSGAVMDVIMNRGLREGETEDEKQVVKLVRSMFQKSKSWKQTWSKDHDRFWNEWEGNHYKGKPAHTLTRAVINQVWSAVETFLGHVSDGLPEPTCRARKLEFKGKAALITKWLRYVVDSNDLEQEVQHPVRSACVTGAGWMNVEWDSSMDGGRGGVRITPRDEKFVFVSPYARNLREALYLIDAANVPKDYVTRTWDKGIPSGIWDADLTNVRAYSETNANDPSNPSYALLSTTTGSDTRWSGSQGLSDTSKGDLVTLVKCYIRQADGTMRLIVVANGVVLQDGPSPYDDDDFPYVVFNVVPTLDTIQGRGIVQFIEGLQDILNSTMSYLLDQQRFSSDPMLIVDVENIEEGQLIDNSPGAVLTNSSQRGNGYNWLQAPGFNQAWVQIQEVVTGYMDSVLGRVEILKGENPSGISTLGGLEIIRDEANVRLRSLVRWVRASLKRLELLALSRLRQFAKDERSFRIETEQGREEFVTVNPSVGVGPSGEIQQDLTIPENAEFDIEFGKESAGGKQARIELAMALAATPAEDGLPMVDRKFVLDQAEIEEAPEIIARLQEMQAQQAQAQQAAEGQIAPQQTDPVAAAMSLFQGGRISA